MLDADLAEMYGVETKALKQAVRRNPARFPDDFIFILTRLEFHHLRSQFVTSSDESGHGGARALPMALIFGILEKLLVQEEKPRNPIGFRIPAKE